MFDIGWSEIAVIAVVALIAIGPKELPGVLRMVGQWMGKARKMAAEFQGQFQEAMREAEMADLKKSFDEVKEAASGFTGGNLMTSLEKDVSKALDIEGIDKPAVAATETATAEIAATEPDNSNVLEQLKDLYNRLKSEDAVIRVSEMLSQAYRRQGRWASAILENQNLLLRLPINSKAAGEMRYRIRHDTYNLNAQLVACEELAEVRPDNYRFLEMLKHSYSLLDIDDKRDRFSRMLARAYVVKQKWEQAIREYREILQRNPNDGDAVKALAEIEARIAVSAADSATA